MFVVIQEKTWKTIEQYKAFQSIERTTLQTTVIDTSDDIHISTLSLCQNLVASVNKAIYTVSQFMK